MSRSAAIFIAAVVLTACAPRPESALGFRLPDGNADRGLQAFTNLQCHACHSVEGLDIEFTGSGAASVMLGGKVSHVKTYGELVTSIINPSHKIAPRYAQGTVTSDDGESLMSLAYINEIMTVQQLIDVVAFLEARYQVVVPQFDPYTTIYP
jgi:mono/diheme cytochrome c family protein